jgi:hypothetical protein
MKRESLQRYKRANSAKVRRDREKGVPDDT